MLIGVTGCSGSGKSTFVKYLQKHLELPYTLFTQDNYYIARDLQPRDDQGIHNFDLPSSLDLKKYYEDLLTLHKGEAITQTKYNYNNPLLPSEQLKIHSSTVLITEGLFIFHEVGYRDLFDIKVFIESPEQMSFSRRLHRDEEERGYGFDDVNYRFHKHVVPSYMEHIAPLRDQCDMVVSNHSNDLSALEQSAMTLAQKIAAGKIR